MSDPVHRQVPHPRRPTTAAAPGPRSRRRGCPLRLTASSASPRAAPAWSPRAADDAWIASGGAAARVFHTDRPRTRPGPPPTPGPPAATPAASSRSRCATPQSLRRRRRRLREAERRPDTAAYSHDGGPTWTAGRRPRRLPLRLAVPPAHAVTGPADRRHRGRPDRHRRLAPTAASPGAGPPAAPSTRSSARATAPAGPRARGPRRAAATGCGRVATTGSPRWVGMRALLGFLFAALLFGAGLPAPASADGLPIPLPTSRRATSPASTTGAAGPARRSRSRSCSCTARSATAAPARRTLHALLGPGFCVFSLDYGNRAPPTSRTSAQTLDVRRPGAGRRPAPRR